MILHHLSQEFSGGEPQTLLPDTFPGKPNFCKREITTANLSFLPFSFPLLLVLFFACQNYRKFGTPPDENSWIHTFTFGPSPPPLPLPFSMSMVLSMLSGILRSYLFNNELPLPLIEHIWSYLLLASATPPPPPPAGWDGDWIVTSRNLSPVYLTIDLLCICMFFFFIKTDQILFFCQYWWKTLDGRGKQ